MYTRCGEQSGGKAARPRVAQPSTPGEQCASARRKKGAEEDSAVRRKEALDSGPSAAKVLRQLDRRMQRIKAKQQKQHWGTRPLKEWESERGRSVPGPRCG